MGRRVFKLALWFFILWVFFRGCVFRIQGISTDGMQGNLFDGDFVIINKLAYGARSPITPLSVGKSYAGWLSLPYMRMAGFSAIKRNDIVAFNYSADDNEPIDIRDEYIKRCVGMPGDSIGLRNGVVFVNSETAEPANIYNPYTVVATEKLSEGVLKNLQEIKTENNEPNVYRFNMSSEQAAVLLKTGNIKTVTLESESKTSVDTAIFPKHEGFKWNRDYFGPLWIPKKGDSVMLSKENLIIYQKTIERFEEMKVRVSNDSVYINDKFQKYYTFEQNYYFMMDDNRHESKDSRHWGFIPYNHVIGKVSFILYSGREGKSFSTVK